MPEAAISLTSDKLSIGVSLKPSSSFWEPLAGTPGFKKLWNPMGLLQVPLCSRGKFPGAVFTGMAGPVPAIHAVMLQNRVRLYTPVLSII